MEDDVKTDGNETSKQGKFIRIIRIISFITGFVVMCLTIFDPFEYVIGVNLKPIFSFFVDLPLSYIFGISAVGSLIACLLMVPFIKTWPYVIIPGLMAGPFILQSGIIYMDIRTSLTDSQYLYRYEEAIMIFFGIIITIAIYIIGLLIFSKLFSKKKIVDSSESQQ